MQPGNATSRPGPTARAAATRADPRWAAVVSRDPHADGRFVYAVATTGVYCHPSCAARPPLPQNVSFFADAAAAERAGFRACKRCRADAPAPAVRRAEVVARLCRLIEASDDTPSLATLARSAGMSPHHTHRLFKSITGVTPRAYAAAHRDGRVRAALVTAPTITTAIHDAGFGSSARFYERADAVLGMTPRQFREGGRDVEIRYAIAACSLGAVLVATSDRGVCAILLGDDRDALVRELAQRFARARLVGDDRGHADVVERVVAMVEDPRRATALPLDIRGTAFQRRVWQALARIPAGETRTYAEIAAAVDAPASARAVARACAANPLAVAIPCHRVIRQDGGHAGYRWGLARKRALLEREGGT
ncbi:MAG: bifunctional DNA-binding transcriptional regulator/O6-methylguanine-DNA methyltransferase Ada [Nannocystaceae bacterium]|nr:bifunctional DNA-binding transcriptional regulator/O6-methylguanine-DNA methyltransferase Ada [Nannocystaceae bacterium]